MPDSPQTQSTDVMQLSYTSLKNTKTQPSLTDTLSHWLADPTLSYAHWIAPKNLKPSTKDVYKSMFNRFCRWLDAQHLKLNQCNPETILKFLNTLNDDLPASRQRFQQKRQRRQHIRNLKAVFLHLNKDFGMSGNDPGDANSFKDLGGKDDNPTRFLTVDERRAVIALIQTKQDELRKDKKRIDRWHEVRDLAMVGVILGGGLKPLHIRELKLNCINLSEGVIDQSVSKHAHRAVLLPFARDALALWIETFRTIGEETLSGTKARAGGTAVHWKKMDEKTPLFVADRSIRRGGGGDSTTMEIHAASVFRRIRAFLELVEIRGERASPQTLRNTYAALLIEGGSTDAELVICLGLTNARAVERLRNALNQQKNGSYER